MLVWLMAASDIDVDFLTVILVRHFPDFIAVSVMQIIR